MNFRISNALESWDSWGWEQGSQFPGLLIY